MGVDKRGPVRRGALELVSEPGPRLRRERLRAACKVDEVAGVDGHGSNSGLLEVGDEFGRVARAASRRLQAVGLSLKIWRAVAPIWRALRAARMRPVPTPR